jgi:BirA family biotin operon repressor/biotin-[acetyl-CoA-carboxylase] ligase
MTADTAILRALRQPARVPISSLDLARAAGLTRAGLWARIRELRRLGYEIEASPHQGYRLAGGPDALHADDLLARVGLPRIVGREIQVFQATTSTMDVMARFAQDGVREGVVVFAETQSQGRGRLGRAWLSPARCGLWFSLLLRPAVRPQAATQLTIAAATAVARAIENAGPFKPEIKWPNDILLRGKKVAGILTELSAEPDQVRHVIIGIGVDVNVSSSAFPAELRRTATSLKIEAGQPIDRPALAAALLEELEADYARVIGGRFDAVVAEWERRCRTVGRQVTVRLGGREIQGLAEALDDDGALLVRTQHGRIERVTGGDCT